MWHFEHLSAASGKNTDHTNYKSTVDELWARMKNLV